MKMTDFGVAIIEGDEWLSKWVVEQRRLDCEGAARELAAKILRPGDWVVDGGAYIGDHTLAYLNAVGPTGRVMAFEPNPEAYECLHHNCPAADAICAGLSDRKGSAHLHIEAKNPGASRIHRNVDGDTPLIALDAFGLQKLRLLKLDLEGMEYLAIQGAEETIRRCHPILAVELNDPLLAVNGLAKGDVIGLMGSLGYRLELMDTRYGLELPQVDVLFVP